MEQRYLIDTNAVIDYLGNKLSAEGMEFMNPIIDIVPCISVMTKIEVLGFNAPVEHYQLLKDFIDDSNVIELNDDVVNKCIEIRKSHKIKLPDAIIASSALVYELAIITRNTSDFKNIEGIQIIDPFDW